jgi:hypothetical protein
VEQLQDPRPPLGGFVDLDVQLGDAAQAQPTAQLATDEGHCPAKRGQGRRPLGGLPDQADPHARVGQVRGRVHPSHGHETDPRIRHLASQQPADLLAEQFVDPFEALAHTWLRAAGLTGAQSPWTPGIVSRARTG